MGKLSKEIYQAKEQWAIKRNERNALNINLTEEQHEFLADLCKFRHDLHTEHNGVFNSNSGTTKEYCNQIDENCICEIAKEESFYHKGYKLFKKYPFNLVDLIQNYYADDVETFCCNLQNYDELMEMNHEEAYLTLYEMCIEQLENIDRQICSFLDDIDKKYGADYSPSHMTRE